ncbi:hypothetical protein [Chitinophaga sp. MM2321]|uniref:hypothetical protein n=1 Tax=Chitinophaga sp. MM2321 TaxID=3137178 RepID=UPI0032D57527
MKDITHSELFETLVNGEIDGEYYDLHNDYQCIKISCNAAEKKVEMRFINDDYKIIVTFSQATIVNCVFNPGKPPGGNTLDLFFRGRFEKNNNLHEMTDLGEYYYHIKFQEDDILEIFARQVVLKMSRLNS